MYTIVLFIHILACIGLITVVLLQPGRGSSLSNVFGGGGAESLFGPKAADVLTKATAVCAITFFLTSSVLVLISLHGRRSVTEDIEKTIEEEKTGLDYGYIPKTLEETKQESQEAPVQPEPQQEVEAPKEEAVPLKEIELEEKQ